MTEDIKEKQSKETKKVSSSTVFDLQAEMDNLPLGGRAEFRVSLDGSIVKGHYVDRVKLIPTSDGYKFRIERGEQGVKMRNIDYGWQRQVDLKDEYGNTYDTVSVNAQGTKDVPELENKVYTMAEEMTRDMINWLQVREKERLGS